MYDFHTHTTYSDGRFMGWMARTAESAGYDGIGFADHCTVSTREPQRSYRRRRGFNLDLTYERRRAAIDEVREAVSIPLYDAAEVDYHPDDEAEIASLLDEAEFDYALGSVHFLDGHNVHHEEPFAAADEATRREYVDRYVEKLVALIESELFEIASHPDLVERNSVLRGVATRDHYERVADAFAASRTVPEINAGRALRDYGKFHPRPAFAEVLLDRGIAFTPGTDSHTPDQLEARHDPLADRFAELGIEPIHPLG
ncbi:histidinol-phosphatase [Halobacteriales archaeon SW_7_68_16]|nr:MAG: histidinol-phosphatase [Halobacteriales archaeon SW_7_68_16]